MIRAAGAAAVVCLLGCTLLTGSDDAAPRPSFLVLLCDDLGYGDVGFNGGTTIRTPRLDRLAEEGMVLTDFYAAAPVCSPSRVGLLTGRAPDLAGVYDWIPDGSVMHMPAGETTIAGLLQEAGYATCHVGKWHCNGMFDSDEQPQPGDFGFDHWFSTQNNAAPSHEDPENFVRDGEPVGVVEGWSSGIVADEAIRWLRDERDPDAPFFLFACFHEPHEPVASPPELVASYPDATKRGEALYYANVSNMDRAVGRMMDALDELGLAGETVVVFTSDNGPETLDRYRGAWRSHGSPGPLRGMKLHVYEGGIRVPALVRWPGVVEPGSRSSAPAGSVDLLPTFAAAAGVTPPERRLDGTDIRPLLGGGEPERERALFWHYYRAIGPAKVALREGDWKVVAHAKIDRTARGSFSPEDVDAIKGAELTRFELYDLPDDVGEENDLADELPDVLERLRGTLEARFEALQRDCPSW